MSRSNYDKPFYVDVGTSIVAIRCASNHDVIERYDHVWHPHTLELAKDVCDRMNTAEEQCDRFLRFCQSRGCVNCEIGDGNRAKFPSCELVWAQMPYEEGGAK